MFNPVKLLSEVMSLAYLVNASTEYCTFVHYAGHVEALQVIIFPGKENCTTDKAIFDSYFYIDGRHKTNSEKLLFEVKNTLEGYLSQSIEKEE